MEITPLIEGKCYYVWDGKKENPSFWMLGIVVVGNNGQNDDGCQRGISDGINSNHEFKFGREWSYKSQGRNYRFATEKERIWVETCIAKNRYIPQSEISYSFEALIIN